MPLLYEHWKSNLDKREHSSQDIRLKKSDTECQQKHKNWHSV